ncbi:MULTISPECIES: transposase [Flavobacterium]|uniref:Transposase n=1 Tax=Flavobacterium jumunjinense TaxID=998845 RepID=A0ABV5GK27_9FLAO|nr:MULTISPECIES: transposase [Flavobacterium]
MTKFNNKYRIESTRLQHWDYGQKAVYFVTICTANREHFFGSIEETPCIEEMPCVVVETPSMASLQMVPSEIGKIVAEEWIKTPQIRPDMHLELGEFIVMPNHFHGIIFIGNNEFNGRDAINGVSTIHGNGDAMHGNGNVYKNQFGPQSKNLASIIRGFKSAVTVRARRINPDFGWQARFHDHIIRNPNAYENISQYIIDNPKKWNLDVFNK